MVEMARCSDPVLSASALLTQSSSEDRMRGLGVLRDLERVVLDEAVSSEVLAVSLVCEMGEDARRQRTNSHQWLLTLDHSLEEPVLPPRGLKKWHAYMNATAGRENLAE